jgi:hypothetical protein
LIFEIPRLFKNPVIRNLIKCRNYWIIDSGFDFITKIEGMIKVDVRKGQGGVGNTLLWLQWGLTNPG